MSTRPITPAARAAVISAVMMLVLAGCGNSASRYLGGGDTEDPMTLEQQFAQLMQRPDLDEALVRHNELLDKLKTRLSTELGFPEWNHDPNDISHSSCAGGPFGDVDLWDAGTQSTHTYVSRKAITIEQWPVVKTLLASVGGEYGFTKPGFTLNGPPQQFITRLYDHHGAELGILIDANAVLGVTSGCHLFAEAKQRGTPRPTRTY